MANQKPFQHQDYAAPVSPESYELISPSELISPTDDKFKVMLADSGSRLRALGVARIILVHGTMAGTDALGWYSHWERVVPGLSKRLKRTYKSVVDRLSGDRGNFTEEYETLLVESINSGATENRIAVERFEWTSENHHLGRADAAVRLVSRLIELGDAEKRVLLVGHSHAGNVFALASQLIGNDGLSNKPFFAASRGFHEASGRIDAEAWKFVANEIANREIPQLDVVTMGTPVRYGWNESALKNLIHFVNHRVSKPAEPYRGFVPGNGKEFLEAIQGEHGDFVQQTFVARTDFPPAIWSWRAWKANRILRNLLESSELKHKRLWRTKQAARVAQAGKTLLVDYAKVDPTGSDIAGHSIYTEFDWMAFQFDQVANRLNS